MEIKTEQFVNSPVVTVSFDVLHDDWCLIQQSETWKRIENFFEVSGNRDNQMTLTEKINLLETGQCKQDINQCAEEIMQVLKKHKTSVYNAKIILKKVKAQVYTKSLVLSGMTEAVYSPDSSVRTDE